MTDDMLAMQERLAERQELERLRGEAKRWQDIAVKSVAEVNRLRQRVAQLEMIDVRAFTQLQMHGMRQADPAERWPLWLNAEGRP